MSSKILGGCPATRRAAANMGSLTSIPQCAHAVRSISMCGGPEGPAAHPLTPTARTPSNRNRNMSITVAWGPEPVACYFGSTISQPCISR
jgi:hypothetical protein